MPRDPGQTERLIRRLRWDELDRAWLLRFAEFAREEDLAGLGLAERPLRVGDPSAALLAGAERARARVVARRPMVLAGLGLLDVVFAAYGGRCHAKPLAYDGQYVPAGTAVAEVEGPAAELLSAERILLNFLQRLCGVATHTREHVLALGSSPTKLLDTRKTTPGFRMLEKYAVGQGGGYNHRLGLFDRIMVKDNHLAAGGATAGERITKLVRRARESRPDLLVEVEVDRLDQIGPVLAAGADIILLDNFPVADLRIAIPQLRGLAWSEVSGGVSLDSLPLIGALAPDFVSSGALTHAAPWCDVGLDWL
ncbi:MAG: carboxylating nicotinate-nucleotide diphosphorylase [Verrucomicrobia bacterium]|jgi:nicotinate-nucleotide pyrophosphorylase (carboxylating)|nr:carboxylating nicotinate-nucleotide diphosphorylase [Verrucomicrobiota bacterium]